MKLIKLQLITLRAFCLSLIALIDVCLQEEDTSRPEQDTIKYCQHQDKIAIPTMGGGTQELCRTCGIQIPLPGPQSEGD